jgi:hypothetical protein
MENQITHEKQDKSNVIYKLFKSIKKDISNLDKFWKKYKKIIYCIIVIFIILQVVNLIDLQNIFNSPCKNQGIIQKGGVDTTSPLSNIFGKFGTIFRSAFKIVGIILLISIIGFLPILVMIVLTYKVLTYMGKKVKGL